MARFFIFKVLQDGGLAASRSSNEKTVGISGIAYG
jgi:hypothetical protein